MKYSIYIAEDEPPILRNIIKKIHQLDGDLEVVGQAFNGEDAFNDIMRLHPDILITDIRMPIMDGLCLVKKIKDNGLDTACVILSGYQEFEYAKQALKLGVEDYLLKPLSQEAFAHILIELKARINEEKHIKGYKILTRIINMKADISDLESLENGLYGILLLCINNPLSSFPSSKEYINHTSSIISAMELDDIMRESLEELGGKYWIFDGNYPNERIIITSLDHKYINILKGIAVNIYGKFQNTNDYITIAFENNFVEREQIASTLPKLQQIIRECAVVGKSRILSETDRDETYIHLVSVYSGLDKKMSYFCRNGQIKLLKDEISKNFLEWGKAPINKRVLEINLKHIVRCCCQNVSIVFRNENLQVDKVVDEIFMKYNSLDAIEAEFIRAIEKLFNAQEETAKERNEQLVKKIVNYLNANLAEEISLQEIAESFGISESYLSKIFKKHMRESPINYLLRIRIERAKQYIKDCPQMMMKDVANMTGFSDQYYFSRIFKSFTGKSPTEYKEK